LYQPTMMPVSRPLSSHQSSSAAAGGWACGLCPPRSGIPTAVFEPKTHTKRDTKLAGSPSFTEHSEGNNRVTSRWTGSCSVWRLSGQQIQLADCQIAPLSQSRTAGRHTTLDGRRSIKSQRLATARWLDHPEGHPVVSQRHLLEQTGEWGPALSGAVWPVTQYWRRRSLTVLLD